MKVLFFCFFTKWCNAVPFLDRVYVHFEVCCIKVAEAQRLVSMKLCGLWRPEGATREALLSEAGFEKVFRTQNWVRRRKVFCR